MCLVSFASSSAHYVFSPEEHTADLFLFVSPSVAVAHNCAVL